MEKSLSNSRINFLEAYSHLESSVSRLIQALLDVDARIAWSIYYRVSSTRSSYAMIQDFIKVKRPDVKKPWCVIERWLTPIDTARNHIVHWMPIRKRGKHFLANPATYMDLETLEPEKPYTEMKYTPDDIDVFTSKAVKASMIVDKFIYAICDLADSALLDKYLELTNDQNLEEFHKLLMPRGS